MKLNPKQVKERAKKAFAREQQWHDHLDDCYEYCLPNRNLYDREDKGQKKMDRVFDSTAIESIQSGASKLQENIAPIWMEWATLEPSGEVQRLPGFAEAEDDIRENLQKRTEIIFDYINRSNFSSQFYEACLDLMIGTCSIAINETDDNDNPIAFQAIPQKGIAFEEGQDGTVKTHFWKRKVKARNLKIEYPDFKPSHDVNQKILKEPDCEIPLTQGVIYNEKDKTYHGVVMVEDEDRFSWEEDYANSNPWNTARYFKVAGEVRGRGVAMQALPDIKTINKVKEFMLKKAAIDLSGLWTASDDGVTNPYNIVLSPGVVIPVGSNNSQSPSLQRLDTSTDLNLSLFVFDDLKEGIQRMFFNDLRDPAGPVRSATEIAIEARELAKRIGSAFGRLQTELLTPILSRVDWILTRRGILSELKIDGKEVKFKFTSPLARAQDSEDLLSVQQAVEFTMMTAGPEAAKMAYKLEEFGTWAGQKTGMPQELIRDPVEKQKIIQAGAQAAMMGANNDVERPGPQAGQPQS